MIVALGSFDGYHRGHQTLFHEAARLAEQLCCPWMPLTFYPHPAALTNGSALKFLFTESEKELIRNFLNIPTPWVLPFDEGLRSLEAIEFLAQLHWRQRLSGIVVGEDFRFGKGRHGTVSLLQQWCHQQDIVFSALPSLYDSSGHVISSTRARNFIAQGAVQEVTKLLGYPWFFSGAVVSGKKRGRKLGFPTANIAIADDKIMAGEGVYAAATLRSNQWIPVALSIGRNPTFTSRAPLTVEAHLTQLHEDLYGQSLTIWLLQKLRPMKGFQNAEDLAAQIAKDSQESTTVTQQFTSTPMADQLREVLSHDKMGRLRDSHQPR